MKPRDIVSSLQNLISVENSLDVGVENLRNGKSLATVIFFDLIGSTGYRRRYGAEKGLKKAYIHNVHVSRAIVRAGGYVVKWLGDGVMGCFTHEGCGDAHAMKALHAALQTLRDLPQINLQKQHDDEIHTKISICAGAF